MELILNTLGLEVENEGIGWIWSESIYRDHGLGVFEFFAPLSGLVKNSKLLAYVYMA